MKEKGKDVSTIQGFLNFVYGTYKSMENNEINLIYEGEITHQITKAFTSLTEERMEQQDEPKKVQKKVFHVMVECMQNITKHSDSFSSELKKHNTKGRGIFLVSKTEDSYTVTTGNYIDNTNIEELSTLLETINKLDKDGLKKLYKEKMKEGTLSDKGGAGLGFIDIAKKTGNKLDFHFITIDDQTSFFIIKSMVKRIENQ